MSYGYVIRYHGAFGMEYRTADGGFASFEEALRAVTARWGELEGDWRGYDPFDYDIVEE